MDNQHPQKRNIPRSILTTLEYLFIPARDASSIYWTLAAITLIGMVMRFWQIDDPIAYDEAYTFIYYATRQFKHILADYSAPNNHILHTILVRLFYEIFGMQPWTVRLPALLAGTLCIPAAYLAARRILSPYQALAGAALVTLTPWFISYSANGRGYTLILLLSLILANLGALLIEGQKRSALAAYAITAALGFYTIPIFLYPMIGISLWVLATHLTAHESWKDRSAKVWPFLAACAAAALLTLLLYSPVIFFGTGWESITSNEFVASRGWTEFENLRPRMIRTWESWMQGVPKLIENFLVIGFLVSLFFYRKASRQRLPLQIFLMLAIPILIVPQRVVPLARVWMYLEAFYLIFAGAGLVWLSELGLSRLVKPTTTTRILPAAILLLVSGIFVHQYFSSERGPATANPDLPEQYAAEFLTVHLKEGDKILSISPVDIQTAYYLLLDGVPYDVFYQRDHPAELQNAIVVLRTNSKYNTPESVLDFYKLTDGFDLASARLIFEYGPLQIFSIPAE